MTNLAIFSSHNGSGFDALYKAYKSKILNINIRLLISNNSDAKCITNAKKRDIDAYVINKNTCKNIDDSIFNLLKKYECKTVFLSGYMKKISPKICNNFKIINCHPALLPKFGGQGMYGRFIHESVIKNKEKESGVTIHEVNSKYDDGKIILQNKLIIKNSDNVDALEKKIKKLESKTIVDAFKICLN